MSEFLSNNPFANLKKSHPARVYMEEASYIRELIVKINSIDIVNNYEEFLKVFEEFRLLPNAMQLLQSEDWDEMRR